MERIKSTLLLLMITLFVLLSGCNKQPNLSKGQVKKQEIDAAMKTWEEIARSNEKYLEGDGWLELSTVASPAPDARKFYTNLQAWYLLEGRNVINGLTSITDTETRKELQRFVINTEGIRADLIELRYSGLDATEYAHPAQVDFNLKDISLTRQDLNLVTDRKSIIRNIEIEETVDQFSIPILIITVEFDMINDAGRANATSQLSDYIGEVQRYSYDQNTGSCIEREEYYLTKGGHQTGSSIIRFTSIKHEELPTWVTEELENAFEELDFYIQLFLDPKK